MALTAAQITRIRQSVGDPDSVDFTDPLIQSYWTDAGNDDDTDTYRYDCYITLLEIRLGKYINLTNDSYERGSSQRSGKVSQIRELLDYYRGLNGDHGGKMSTGVWSFEIDTNDDDTDS